MGVRRGRHHIRPPAWLVVVLLSALATLTGSSLVVVVVRLAGLLIVALLVIAIETGRREEDAALLVRERAARKEAEAATRSKDDFFLTISHELRGPLSAILNWVHLLRAGKLDDATAVRALETIERNARAEARLIADMLEVSRIIGGKIRLDVRPVELATVIAEAADSVRPAAEARDILLEVNSSVPIGVVAGDPGRLQQVMENLFSNAIKFTPRGGRIIADVSYDAEHATIAVSDTGQGIRSDFLSHVFDRFGQADGTATRLGGLGLGLTIVRHLVELHGGTVAAASAGDGQGSTFTVMLPLSPVGTGNGRGAPAAPVVRRATPSGGDAATEMSR